MRQLARWYNIEVIYQDKVNDHFTGTISRNARIEKVLQNAGIDRRSSLPGKRR